MRRRSRAILGIVLLGLLAPEAALAAPTRGLLAPGSGALGSSPSEILTSYNRWIVGTPAADNPMFTERCEASPLSPRLWFVPPSSDPIRCSVPKGAYLAIPVVWFECSSLEAPPFYGNDPTTLLLCLDAFGAGVTAATFTADGVRTTDLRPWTVTSDLDIVPAPNLFSSTLSGLTMARSYLLILPPPRLGTHTYEAAAQLLFDPYFVQTTWEITAS
jgi:hypothetical protein